MEEEAGLGNHGRGVSQAAYIQEEETAVDIFLWSRGRCWHSYGSEALLVLDMVILMSNNTHSFRTSFTLDKPLRESREDTMCSSASTCFI